VLARDSVRMIGEHGSLAGRTVLDVGAGPVQFAEAFATAGARYVALDADPSELRSKPAVAARGERLPVADGSVDALTVTYLLRYVADPGATVRELARVVRPGGVVSSLEFAVPEHPLWHPAWVFYTRTLLPLLGLVAGGPEWWRVGRFLGPSISEHYRRYPVDWHVRAWEEAGLVDVHVRRMSLGGGLVMWARRADV